MPSAYLALGIRLCQMLKGCLHKYVCVSLCFFLPDKVCVFLVSISQTWQETSLNPPSTLLSSLALFPWLRGRGLPREELALFLSFLSVLGVVVCPLPLLPLLPPQLGYLISIRVGGRLGGGVVREPEALCNYRAPPHKSTEDQGATSSERGVNSSAVR